MTEGSDPGDFGGSKEVVDPSKENLSKEPLEDTKVGTKKANRDKNASPNVKKNAKAGKGAKKRSGDTTNGDTTNDETGDLSSRMRSPQRTEDGITSPLSPDGGESPPKKSRKCLLIFLGVVIALVTLAAVGLAVLYVLDLKKVNDLEEQLKKAEEQAAGEEDLFEFKCADINQCKKKGKRPLFVISFDGFAKRYLKRNLTSMFKKFGACGAVPEYMYPSFPAKTFANHYTMVTGVNPGKHGVIENTFVRDGKLFNLSDSYYYQDAKPVWAIASDLGKKTAAHHWLASLLTYKGKKNWTDGGPYDRHDMKHWPKLEKAIANLENGYDFVLAYLEYPDRGGHQYGPDSEGQNNQLKEVNVLLSKTLRLLKEKNLLGCVNIVLVSDHGMSYLDKKIDTRPGHGFPVNVSKSKLEAIPKTNIMFYKKVDMEPLRCLSGADFRVYRSQHELPIRHHYDHRVVSFPYVLGNPGIYFKEDETDIGNHGWDNRFAEMNANMMVAGPSIKENVTLPYFQNVELLNLFTDLLELPVQNTDGTYGILHPVLKNPPKIPEAKRKEQICDESHKITFCSKKTINDTDHHFSMNTRTAADGCFIDGQARYLIRNSQIVATELFLNKKETIPINKLTKVSAELTSNGKTNTKCKDSIDNNNLPLLPSTEDEYTVATVKGVKKYTAFVFQSLLSWVVKSVHSNQKNPVRLQTGVVYNGTKPSHLWLTSFSCRNNNWLKNNIGCKKVEDTVSYAYIIPNIEEDFNCLSYTDFIFDHRARFKDIELLANVTLLSQETPIADRLITLTRYPIAA